MMQYGSNSIFNISRNVKYLTRTMTVTIIWATKTPLMQSPLSEDERDHAVDVVVVVVGTTRRYWRDEASYQPRTDSLWNAGATPTNWGIDVVWNARRNHLRGFGIGMPFSVDDKTGMTGNNSPMVRFSLHISAESQVSPPLRRDLMRMFFVSRFG